MLNKVYDCSVEVILNNNLGSSRLCCKQHVATPSRQMEKNMRVDELFNWMVEKRFVPKSLDALRGHKV